MTNDPAEFSFEPLTPISFLDRAAASFASRTAVVDGSRRLSYRELAERCTRLVSGLAGLGVSRGDRVAALCTNSLELLELHNAVPARGAVLVAINTRLSEPDMRFLLEHSGSRLLVATEEFAERARVLASAAGIDLVIAGGPDDSYTELTDVVPSPGHRIVPDERDLIAINYTSGTTGRPKGVMYHHRGAYLQSLAMAYQARLEPQSRYLWTLPMFHCNGWCFTWAVTAAGGTHVCLRGLVPAQVWRSLRADRVTHLSAAPTVMIMLAEDPSATSLETRVRVDTGGAPPSPALLSRLDWLGFDVTHLYGLTETFGPVAVNEWQPEWDDHDSDQISKLRARQGIGNIVARPLRVLDVAGHDVPADGRTLGEIAVRGNNVMLGYYQDPDATAAVTEDGCFLTGDLAVMHPDGYVEIRDRRKDIIVSGGENIASVEVEQMLALHPDVVEAAVVGAPDERWGEVPVAYVAMRAHATAGAADLEAHARQHLAGFKVPRRFVFGELPKTATGKIQKSVLRTREAKA